MVHIRAHGSQAKLADGLGVNQGNISRYARGESTPGLKTRVRLEDVCGIPVRAWDQPPTEERGDAA